MKKHGIYFVFLAFSAIFAILASCGSDEIAELPQGWQTDMDGLTDPTGGLISQCERGFITEGCPTKGRSSSGIESSSSGEGSSSSVDESSSSGDEVSSSSSEGVSSSSVGSSSSSESVSSGSGSSSSGSGNGYAIPPFSCTWTPGSVVSGDMAQVNINYIGTPPPEHECSGEIRIEVKNPLTGVLLNNSYATIDIATDVQTAGTIAGTPAGIFTWPTSGSTGAAIKARVNCAGEGKEPNSEDKECPLTITAPPTPAKTLGTSISFAGFSHSGIYFKGATPQVTNNVTVGNNDASPSPKCDPVETTFRIEGNTNAAGTIKAYAITTCRGTEYKLDSAEATVVQDPALAGNCVWTPGGVDIGIGEATLGGVSIERDYERCTPVDYSGPYPLPLQVTPQIAADNPGGSIGGFSASSNCGIYGGDLTKACSPLLYDNLNVPPELEVGDCDYNWTWCSPDGTEARGWPFASVMRDYSYTSSLQNACVFVKNIANLGSGTWKINGQNYVSANQNSSVDLSNYPKADEGYYVWLPSNTAIDGQAKFNVTPGTPECTPGTPRRAVTICKDHCGVSGGVKGTIEKDMEYILTVYGQSNCANLRQNSGQTCQFFLDGTSVGNIGGTNIGSGVNVNTPKTIKYTGCSAGSVQLNCN